MRSVLLVAMVAGALWACKSTDPLKSGVQVSFATRNPAVTPSAWLAAPLAGPAAIEGDTLRDGTNTLVIDKAEVVLKKIELERSGFTGCTGASEGCQEVAVGPVLVDLPLGLGAQTKFTVNVPAGTYEKVQFEVHKLTADDPAEAALRQVHPEFVGKSIRVQGQFNGVAFVYETELDVEQELTMTPPLSVTAMTVSTNLTIRVTLSDWFRNTTGGLLNPSTANKGGVNESLVNDNIQKSMKAFEDKDHNGDERDG